MKALPILFLILLTAIAAPGDVTTRFKVPPGYAPVKTETNGFGAYLQALPLKPVGSHTKIYTGAIARTDAYTAAVVDISVGTQDLQQCADAVMRLRGEYLYHQKDYNSIAFKFTSGFKCDYTHYADGYRYKNDRWVFAGKKDYSYPNFLRYMNLVFSYAGTLSLDKELKKVTSVDDLQVGDIFIHGGSPGHCFIVMNVANNSSHKKIFMLAQSFMPAQDIQILQDGSPWFSLDRANNIPYGELVDLKYLKRFN